MNKGRLILVIVVALLLVVGVFWWTGRSHEGDDRDTLSRDDVEGGWVESLGRRVEGIGGGFGLRPEIRLARIVAECRQGRNVTLSGECDLMIGEDSDTPQSSLNLVLRQGQASALFHPPDTVMSEDDRENISPGDTIKLVILREGGRLNLRCAGTGGGCRFDIVKP